MHEDAKRKVDEDRCGGVANPLAPLTDSHLRVCVCLGVRHSDNICQGRLPAPPSLNTDGKVVFLVENGARVWIFGTQTGDFTPLPCLRARFPHPS